MTSERIQGTIDYNNLEQVVKEFENKPKPVMPTNPHKDLEEQILNCKSCDKPLLSYISTTQRVDGLYFEAKCPYCDSKSWRVPYKGRLKIAGIDGKTRISGYDGNIILLTQVDKN